MPSGLFSYSILTFIDGQQYKYLTWEKLAQVTFLPPPKKEVMFLVRSVCLSVCLSVGLLANLWMDFDEIFWRGRAWLKDQVIQFWWRSGSHFGSGSPKSEIRILRIGGGLCSLSISSLLLLLNVFALHMWNKSENNDFPMSLHSTNRCLKHLSE